MDTHKSSQWKEAYDMALRGYAVPVIYRQTGISSQKCRNLFNMLTEFGYRVHSKKRIKTSAMLMRNRESKKNASLFTLIYLVLGEQGVYESIDRFILEDAFELYHEIQENMKISNAKNMDTINDAWSIARELRDKKAYIWRCRSCDMDYLITHEQYTTTDCPFCSPKNKH